MKTKRIIVVLMILTLFIIGCTSNNSSELPSEYPDVSNPVLSYPVPESTMPIPSYPAPEIAYTESAYPAPGSSVEANPDSVFPDLEEGAEISWDEAKLILKSGEVGIIRVKGEPTDVIIILNDGRMIHTIADNQIIVIDAIRECGEICGRIKYFQD